MYVTVQTISNTPEAGTDTCISCNSGNLLLMKFPCKRSLNVFVEKLVEKFEVCKLFNLCLWRSDILPSHLVVCVIGYLANVMTAPQFVSFMSISICQGLPNSSDYHVPSVWDYSWHPGILASWCPGSRSFSGCFLVWSLLWHRDTAIFHSVPFRDLLPKFQGVDMY